MRQPTAGYDERLTVPWHWWPPALAVSGAIALQLGLAIPMLNAWLPLAVLLPATAVGLWWLGRLRVAVVDDELRVDDARLPVRYVATAIPLDQSGRRELLGVGADPLAFVVQRPWVRGAVQVLLDDPADPTPYWLVSARAPERLARAITGAGQPTPADPPSGSRAG